MYCGVTNLDVELPLHLGPEDGRARRALVQLALVAVLDGKVNLKRNQDQSRRCTADQRHSERTFCRFEKIDDDDFSLPLVTRTFTPTRRILCDGSSQRNDNF